MKYLSKEELEDITSELLNNPTRETLKVLSNKYNDGEKVVEMPTSGMSENVNPEPHINIPTFEVPSVNNEVSFNENNNIPAVEVPKFEPVVNTPSAGVEVSVFNTGVNLSDSIPTLEVPQTPKVENNTSVNFSGNLWEPQMPSIGNMMETTDNFNTVQSTIPQNTMPNTNPNMETPFFGEPTPTVNNQIPVSGPSNNGPSMFGQIQQNYNTGV